MDKEEAFKILELEITANAEQVEEKFKLLANQNHPDRGGSGDAMARLNVARDKAHEFLAVKRPLVPIESIHQIVLASQEKLVEHQQLTEKANESKNEIRARSTNRLRGSRRVAGIFVAISAVVTFFGKQIPKDILPSEPPPFYVNFLQEKDEIKLRDRWINDVDELTRGLTLLGFVVLTMAGGIAWVITNRIDKIEHDVKDFEELTNSKRMMFLFLKQLLGDKINAQWSFDQFSSAIEEWAFDNIRLHSGLSRARSRPSRFFILSPINEYTNALQLNHLPRAIGIHSFANYVLDRSLVLGLIESMESYEDGVLVETYVIKPLSGSK